MNILYCWRINSNGSLVAAAFLVSPYSAFTGSCIPLIDKALSGGNVQYVERTKSLRDKGEALHKSGDHGGSVTVLTNAIRIGGNID